MPRRFCGNGLKAFIADIYKGEMLQSRLTLRRLLRRLTARVNLAYACAADSASHCQSI